MSSRSASSRRSTLTAASSPNEAKRNPGPPPPHSAALHAGYDLAGRRAALDPVTVEVIRRRLVAIADEVDVNITRTAFSPYIYEYKDYAVGIVDHRGALADQGAAMVDDADRIVLVLVDVRAERGACDVDVDLVGDRHQPATDHLDGDRIERSAATCEVVARMERSGMRGRGGRISLRFIGATGSSQCRSP